MKKLSVKKGETCMACLQCVQACSEAFYKVNDVTKSCIQIVAGKNGEAKPMVCIQCGKCVEVCPMKVMVKNDDAPTSKCIACGICVKACPMEVLEIVEK